MDRLTKPLLVVAALAAAALGGSALAGAASQSQSPTTPTGSSAARPPQGAPMGPHGRHAGPDGQEEQALPSAVASKVASAAKAKVPGATVERTETDVDHGSPYEAHLRKSDGTELEVLVNQDFQVTGVNTMRHP